MDAYHYTLHPHERQNVDGHFIPGMDARMLQEHDDHGRWTVYRETPDLVEMRHANGAVMKVKIVDKRAMSYELLERDAAIEAEKAWKAFLATGHREDRQRAVLAGSQLTAHRAWLRLGTGEHFDLRDKRYEAQVAVGWTFARGMLQNCAFIRCNLSSANLNGATVNECLFDHADMEMTKFDGALVNNCVFEQAHALGIFVEDARFTGCVFRGGTLATVTWRRTTVSRCRFEGTALRKSRLPETKFVDCRFVGCDFTGTDWQGVDVSGCVFESCIAGPPTG